MWQPLQTMSRSVENTVDSGYELRLSSLLLQSPSYGISRKVIELLRTCFIISKGGMLIPLSQTCGEDQMRVFGRCSKITKCHPNERGYGADARFLGCCLRDLSSEYPSFLTLGQKKEVHRFNFTVTIGYGNDNSVKLVRTQKTGEGPQETLYDHA